MGRDSTDVADPQGVAFLGFGGSLLGVALKDQMAFVGGRFGGVQILDLRVPTSPVQLATVAGIPAVQGFHLEGDALFMASHRYGVRIVDVWDPQAAYVVGGFDDDDSGEALAISAVGEDAIVADNFRIEWLDVSDPTDVRQAAECGGVNGAHDVAFDGTHIYVAEGKRGLIVLRSSG